MTLREVAATRAGGKLSLRELAAEQEAAYGNFMNVAATITGLDELRTQRARHPHLHFHHRAAERSSLG
jgi:hypothetical protein